MSNSRKLSKVPSGLANNVYEILSIDANSNIFWTRNYAYDVANSAFEVANNSVLQGESSFSQANTATTQAQAGFGQANLAFGQANTATTQAQAGFGQANLSFGQANTATTQAQAGFSQANLAFGQANTATTQAQAGFDQANTATTQAQASFVQANNAFQTANTKFNSSGGTISGNVNIEGSLQIDANLIVSGTVTTISSNNLSIIDNMIYLNGGANVVNPDLGFAAGYDDGVYHHTGFFRDATDGIWKVFDNYEPEPNQSVYIDTSNSTFRIADFQANNIIANNFSGTSNDSIHFDGHNSSYYLEYINSNIQSNVSVLTGVDLYQNNSIIMIQGVDASQNNSIIEIQGVDSTQNTWISSNASTLIAVNNYAYAANSFLQANDYTTLTTALSTALAFSIALG